MLRGRRTDNAARARHHLWTVLRHTLDLSYPKLARAFGCDHSTIVSGVQKFERALTAAYATEPTQSAVYSRESL
jgi:chromosomal replication initiation ATPase DnaA